MPRVELAGKPIVITGASSGIGRATAIACAQASMPVALGARRLEKLRGVVDEIERAGGRAIAVETDVTDPEACRGLLAEAEAAFGSVYAVFANAGYGVEAPVHEMTDEDVRAIFETNLYGSMNIIRPALDLMLRAGEGHVLMCSSCLARMPIPYYAAYSATKAAQHHLGRAMGLELRGTGVHVTTVHPIGTRTEFFDVVKTRGGGKSLVQHTSERLMQRPSFVAGLIVKSLRRPRPEVWPGLTGNAVRYGMSIAGMFPRIADLGVRKMVDEHNRNHSTDID